MIRLAVFGQPIAHSLSPDIHRQFASQFGLAIDYRAIESSLAEFPGKLRELQVAGGLGCNVTVPLKHAAFAAARELSPAAEQAQAVNTLLFRGKDDWYGTTTDGDGLLRDLQRLLPEKLAGKRILLIGAGGAAAGLVGTLLQQSPARLLIVNRDAGKATDLALRFADFRPVSACSLQDSQEQGPFDLIINATSLGHQGKAPPLHPGWLVADSFCYDLNYGRAAQPWQAACTSRGISFSDGLGMLVEQAALSFEIWTGKQPETFEVLMALRQQLAA
ncbi:MAG TPA: shikimate dehydrogenase [Xanthomonadales bacterium]|nr:shikimate dehydrogenase [Xanthomonadales bacterium]